MEEKVFEYIQFKIKLMQIQPFCSFSSSPIFTILQQAKCLATQENFTFLFQGVMVHLVLLSTPYRKERGNESDCKYIFSLQGPTVQNSIKWYFQGTLLSYRVEDIQRQLTSFFRFLAKKCSATWAGSTFSRSTRFRFSMVSISSRSFLNLFFHRKSNLQ